MLNTEKRKRLQLITSLSNDLATELSRVCSPQDGDFQLSVTNHGDFSVEYTTPDTSEGFFAPTHHQLADAIDTILTGDSGSCFAHHHRN